MRAGFVLALLLVASPALAQGRGNRARLVIVEKDALDEKLADLNDRLSDLMARAKGRERQALKALRADVDDLRDLAANAPDAPRGAYRVYYREQGWEHDRDDDYRAQQQPPPPPPVVVQQPAPVVVVQQPPPPPQQPVVYPITDLALQNMLQAMNREPRVDGRMRVVQQSGPVNYFLVSQVQQMLGRFEFGSDKLQVVRILRPRILDMENSGELYHSFTFGGDKAELRKILGQ
ncbi:MAG TPA: DUF4476 domain-containing protein [Myxococcaceae bacterium]|nr:DUF4476 domain-containing protein [Myxococcaceae bacterium]